MQKSERARQLNHEKWDLLLGRAFGVTAGRQLSLQEARSLAASVAAAMTSEDFLKTVDEAMATLPKQADMVQRRQRLLPLLIPQHMAVMKQFGFEGDTGYVQAQKALMDHLTDAQVANVVMSATRTLFQRAGLSV